MPDQNPSEAAKRMLFYKKTAAPSLSEGEASTSQNIKNALVPVNMRKYISHLLGDRSPITESDFTEKDLDAIRYAIEKQGGGSSGTIGYGDYSPQGFSDFGNPGEGPLDLLKNSYTDPAYRMETTLGMASYRQLPDGSYVVEDRYNFNAPSRKYVNDILKKQNIISIMSEGYKTHGLSGILNILGNAYGDTESEPGTPVSIRLPRKAKKYQEGGEVEMPEEQASPVTEAAKRMLFYKKTAAPSLPPGVIPDTGQLDGMYQEPTVASETARIFGMQPREDRGSILPIYKSNTGLVAPDWMYDIARNATAADMARRGYAVAPEEGVNMALNFTGAGLGTSTLMRKPMGEGGVDLAMNAYHGSPYNIAGKFDVSKAGTGTGAKQYGHGVYFAEARPTAERFKKGAKQKGFDFQAEEKALGIELPTNARSHFMILSQQMPDNPALKPADAAELILSKNPEARNIPKEKLANLFQTYQEKTQGNLYQVDIPDAQVAKMLDWNKPLSEQSPEVLDILKKIPAIQEDLRAGKTLEDLKGGNAYQALAASFNVRQNEAYKLASDFLNAQGIPGVRYDDYYAPGQSNFVVFDPSMVQMLMRNDKPVSTLPSSTTAKEDLAKVEAPSIMTRSGLTELSDYIKNREGGYGLRRVERAADEIPNLEKLYALDALRSAFSGDNARALMTMNPADFEKYAAPLLTNLSQQSKDNIANLKTIQGAGGFSDVPFFLVNKELAGSTGLPWITGHEGRHRSRAMDEAGVQSGLVQFVPRAELREPFPRRSQEQYIEAIRKEMELSGNKIKPEKYYLQETDEKSFQRPAIDLPDIYAKGGEVRKPKEYQEGGEVEMPEEQASPVTEAAKRLLYYKKTAAPTPPTDIARLGKQAGLIGLGFAPGAGVADYFGKFPAVEGGTEPSAVENFQKGNYGTAALQGLGAMGDLAMAVPVAGTAIGSVMKAPRAAQRILSSSTTAKDALAKMPKPSKVLAPASEIGFYSPTEAAALNLQRRSGPGQAFLNDIMKGENVRSDEISAMGLDTFLKGKTNVTADEVRDYIAQNKMQLGETVYGKSKEDIVGLAKRKEVFDKYAQQINSLYVDIDSMPLYMRIGERTIANPRRLRMEDNLNDLQLKRDAEADLVYKLPENKQTKFQNYALPGGENYREIVLTLPSSVDDLAKRQLEIEKLLEATDLTNKQRNALRLEYREASDKIRGGSTYQSNHWDEPNPLAHLRVSDRVTDGKKTLLIDEVQSDWHQAGRERGYNSPDPIKKNPDGSYTVTKPDGTTMQLPAGGNIERFRRDAGLDTGVPDAPYKEDWYQLALRRAVKEAIDGGYDRVALPTGKRVIDRFSDQLRQNVDEINFSTDYRNKDKIIVAASKQGQIMFEGNIVDGKFIDGPAQGKTVNEVLGKSIAKQIYSHDPSSGLGIIKGDDLSIGGEGMKKYYDEIYPGYLNKFGKKYGAESGKTTVDVKGKPEPLFYMDITPKMREEFISGIPMKDGGEVRRYI